MTPLQIKIAKRQQAEDEALKQFLDDIFAKVIPVPVTGCWLWLGRVDNGGYGYCQHGRVHRVTLKHLGGGLRDDQLACHKCDVRLCCNPDHLYAGTAADNARDLQARHPTAKKHWDRVRKRPA